MATSHQEIDGPSSPEELDQLLKIVDIKAWIPLLALSFITAGVLIWSVCGHVPITLEGIGVLVNPGNVKAIQSPASGQIIELSVREGQQLQEGQVIGLLNQPELQQQLDLKEEELGSLRIYYQELEKLEQERLQLENDSTSAERASFEKSLVESQAMLTHLQEKESEHSLAQQKNLIETRKLFEQQSVALRKKLEGLRKLKEEKLIPLELVLEAETGVMENTIKLADLDVKIQSLGVSDIRTEQQLVELKSRNSDLTLQLQQLTLDQQKRVQATFLSRGERALKLAETEREAARLRLQLNKKTKIVSEYSGRVLDVVVSDGQIIESGSRVATIERDDPDATMKCLVYFSVQDGKRIAAGMQGRVTPTTVDRERFGSILGRVAYVSAFPVSAEGAANVVGSQEIARELTGTGSMIEVHVELERDPSPMSISGFRWTSKGPPVKLSAGTTANVRVTIEERAPITFVLPILREWAVGER